MGRFKKQKYNMSYSLSKPFATEFEGLIPFNPFMAREISTTATGPHMCGGFSSGYKGNDHRALNRK